MRVTEEVEQAALQAIVSCEQHALDPENAANALAVALGYLIAMFGVDAEDVYDMIERTRAHVVAKMNAKRANAC